LLDVGDLRGPPPSGACRAPVERNGDYPLAFGTNKETRRAGEQGGCEDAGSEDTWEAASLQNGNAYGRADVGVLARNGERKDLAVGQSLLFAERFGCAGVPVKDAVIEGADPEVGFRASKRSDIETP